MTPRAAVAALLVAGALATSLPAAPRQVFRSGVATVHLPVVVLGRGDVPIRGLTAEDFVVTEDGKPQSIVTFAEGPPGPAVPLHLGLLLDKSESMDRDFDAAANATISLIETLDEARDVTLVEFETGVRVARFEPPSYYRLFERIRSRKLGRMTALYDAMGHYIDGTRQRPGQHLLILVTDGADSSSVLSVTAVRDALRLGHVIVYALGYLNNLTSSDRAKVQGLLSILTRETGGDAFFPSSKADAENMALKIRTEVEARYTLGYTRPAGTADARFRKVEIRLTRPDLKSAKVRSRSGYIAFGG